MFALKSASLYIYAWFHHSQRDTHTLCSLVKQLQQGAIGHTLERLTEVLFCSRT